MPRVKRSVNAKKKRSAIVVEQLPSIPTDGTPLDDLVCARVKRQLDAALRRLPDEQHSTFVLAEFLRLAPEQIAEIEGCTCSTVRSRLSRVKTALLAALNLTEDEP